MSDRHYVITIERQYGSGGRLTGERLAKELGIHFYDEEILKMTSETSAIGEQYFRLADEKAGNKLLYRIVTSLKPDLSEPAKTGHRITSPENLFRFQSSVIRRLAQEESCIFVGRCAEYVLMDEPGLVRVFIYADMGARVKRIREKRYFADNEVERNIRKIDRERRDYHRYYTGQDWENMENYDLILNSAKLGTDGCVQCIIEYLKIRGLLAK